MSEYSFSQVVSRTYVKFSPAVFRINAPQYISVENHCYELARQNLPVAGFGRVRQNAKLLAEEAVVLPLNHARKICNYHLYQ